MKKHQIKKLSIFALKTFLGTIYTALSKRGICAITIPPHDKSYFKKLLNYRYPMANFTLIKAPTVLAGRQLIAYFQFQNIELNAPIDLEGFSAFRQAVMLRLRCITYGQTISYSQLATKSGFPKAARAVGKIMHYNPIPLFVPCHRVIGSNGTMVGYNAGVEIKKKLLKLEYFFRL